MPGFFEGLRRIVQGKPVFMVEDEAGQGRSVPTAAPAAAGGPKVLPMVVIESSNCSSNGAQMTCEVAIQNNSQQNIELDKIRLLGTMRELDSFLRPGEEREYTVYSGPRPQNTYNNKCELQFKNQSGDYFAAVHRLDFDAQSDGTFEIARFSFESPIRDV